MYMIFILSLGFSIPYRMLARVGFEPTTWCLQCNAPTTELSGRTMRRA